MPCVPMFNDSGKTAKNWKIACLWLIVSKSHPFWGASPDNIFSCDCCGETAMEYKCPYSVRGILISEVWDKVEYLEMHEGKLKLKRGHRYYTQITGEMAMSGLERQVKGTHLLNFYILKQSSGRVLAASSSKPYNIFQDLSAKGNSWV